MHRIKFTSVAFLSFVLASCGNSGSSSDAELEDLVAQAEAASNEATAAAKESAALGKEIEDLRNRTPATESTPSSGIPTGGKPTNPEAENTVKAFINLNGELCAQIVSVRPLAKANTAEVTCTEYTGGSTRVTYIINLQSGELQKAG